MSAAALPAANSYAALSPGNVACRIARAPRRPRPAAFAERFDTKTLFYDCFWSAGRTSVLLVGPPPYGLDYERAIFTARPSGDRLRPRFYPSLTTMISELPSVPSGTTDIQIEMDGEDFLLPIQPNSCAELAGSRLLFTINKNNDLRWIREWATYHARLHGTNAIVLFDNASTHYDVTEVRSVLASVPGILHAGVQHWPYSFGLVDEALKINPYWAKFLQIASMSVVLRRYGEHAYGLLDCDVDELAGTRSGASVYDLARHSRGGLVVFRGTWIEASGQGTRHRDYSQRLSDSKAAHSPQRKWALDPTRSWVRRLSVHPYWHWIEGRAWWAKSMSRDAFYWHFKAINTNWKHNRTRAPEGPVVRDELLARRFAQLEAAT